MRSLPSPRPPLEDPRFLAGWGCAVAGGVALLVSAFAGGNDLVAIGVLLAALGFVLIAYTSVRAPAPTPGAHPVPARRTSWAIEAPPAPEGEEDAAFAAESLSGVSDPFPELDPSSRIPAIEPAPVVSVATSGAPWAGTMAPLPGATDPLPTAPPAQRAFLEGVPNGVEGPIELSGDGGPPSNEPSRDSPRVLDSADPPHLPVTSPEPPAAPPGSGPEMPPETTDRARPEFSVTSEVPAASAPDPPPEPATASGGESDPGEVPPAGSLEALALLGLPWDESTIPAGVPASLEAAAGGAPALSGWTQAPSIAFAAGAVRSVDMETPWRVPPPPEPAPDPASRSGGYRARDIESEGLSERWLVPGLSVIRSSPRPTDGMGLVTRVPEPPGRGFRPTRACADCGEPSVAGATGENRCWGCGRTVCSDCFWRHGPGPSIHRCATCAAQGPSTSVSGAHRAPRLIGPFARADESEWSEGI